MGDDRLAAESLPPPCRTDLEMSSLSSGLNIPEEGADVDESMSQGLSNFIGAGADAPPDGLLSSRCVDEQTKSPGRKRT